MRAIIVLLFLACWTLIDSTAEDEVSTRVNRSARRVVLKFAFAMGTDAAFLKLELKYNGKIENHRLYYPSGQDSVSITVDSATWVGMHCTFWRSERNQRNIYSAMNIREDQDSGFFFLGDGVYKGSLDQAHTKKIGGYSTVTYNL